jgi:5'-deoxynucleotidase YfbR-like HD superfamily hydrolase
MIQYEANQTKFSISDHMYRMAILAMLSEDSNLDISKLVQ